MVLLFYIVRAMLLLALALAALVCPVAAVLNTVTFITDVLRFQRPAAAVSAFVCWKQGTGHSYRKIFILPSIQTLHHSPWTS
jgi:hypothetical protein